MTKFVMQNEQKTNFALILMFNIELSYPTI